MTAPLSAWLLIVALLAAGADAPDARPVIDDATRALGATGLTSIVFAGAAAIGNFGQSRTISYGLTSTSIKSYTRTIDFTQPASRATGEPSYEQVITPADTAWSQQLQIWVTPWGFLKGAAANHATLRTKKIDGVAYRVVTWSPPQKAPSGQPYQVVGYIDPQNLIDRVETWVEHPVLGDLHVESFYSDYRDAGGLKIPTKVSQKQVGMETFVAVITAALANPPNLAELLTPSPAQAAGRGSAAAGAAAAQGAASEKIADGVYRITGGYVALAVEFADFVVVVEGGQNEARGLAIIAETKRVFPGKRIKYVVNTHPHFDHASGLAPFAAEGITILTQDNNRYFLEQALGSPRTLVGDALAKSHRKPKVESVIEKMVIQDKTRTIELHRVLNLEHSDGMLVAYLPRERLLFTADFNMPPAGQPPSPSIGTLVQNIERLHLDFDRHVTVHPSEPDRPLTKADLLGLMKP